MAVDRQLATEQVMRQSQRGMSAMQGDKARGVVEQWAVAEPASGSPKAGPALQDSEKNLRESVKNTDSWDQLPEHPDFLGRTGKSAFSQASQGMWMRPEGLERTSPGLFQAEDSMGTRAPFWVPLRLTQGPRPLGLELLLGL